MTTTAPELEGLDGYVPPPYVPPLTLDERLVKAWREVTRTPGRAALATLDLCAIGGFLISLRTIPVTTVDAQGPLRARCGITFYVSGASNPAVKAACRYAFASRVPQLLLLGVVAVGATALLIGSIARPTPHRALWRAVTRTPSGAALATLNAALLVVVFSAAQPVNLATTDPGGALRAHCGLQYYIVGVSDSAVQHACRRAYGPRASVFFIALVVLCIGIAGLVRMVRRPLPETTSG